jgi:hypothetical protein
MVQQRKMRQQVNLTRGNSIQGYPILTITLSLRIFKAFFASDNDMMRKREKNQEMSAFHRES